MSYRTDQTYADFHASSKRVTHNTSYIKYLAGLLLTVSSHLVTADDTARDIVKPVADLAAAAYRYGYQHKHCNAAGADTNSRKALAMYETVCEAGAKDRKNGLRPYPQAAGVTLAEMEGAAAVREKDPDEAYKWFETAANNGRTKAQVTLGQMYRLGYGGRKDCRKSAHWIQTAAETGYPEAQYEMGVMLFGGVCLPQDYVAAEKWYTLAAEQKYAKAWTSLAVMISNGLATERNDGGALLYLKIAEALGDPEAGPLQKQISFPPEQMKQIDQLFNNVMARINAASPDHEPFTLHVPLGRSSASPTPSQQTSRNTPAPAAAPADTDFAQQALDEFSGSSGINLVGVPDAYKKTAGFLRGADQPSSARYSSEYLAWYYHAYRLRKAGAKAPPVIGSAPGTEAYRIQLERLRRMVEMAEWLRKRQGDDVFSGYGRMLDEKVFAPMRDARRNGRQADFEALLSQAVEAHYRLHVTMAEVQKDWK